MHHRSLILLRTGIVNALATDLDLDVLDQNVPDPVQPPELDASGRSRDIGQLDT